MSSRHKNNKNQKKYLKKDTLLAPLGTLSVGAYGENR